MKDSRRPAAFRIRFRPLRASRAFSLHDALIAVAVVSIVATIAVPSLQQLVLKQRMAGAINTLITALHLARSEAIKHRQNVVLCPSADGQSCLKGGNWETGYLAYIDGDADREIGADESVVQVFSASSQLRLRTNAGRPQVRYLPSGLASGSNATFTLCDVHGRGTPRTVVISMAGRVYTSTRLPGGGAIVCPTT